MISYNGEVYNSGSSRAAAAAAGFARHSDTEVIVESVRERGLDRTLADLNGMFAIALWDRASARCISSATGSASSRSSMRQTRRVLCFASELKALRSRGVRTRDRSCVSRELSALWLCTGAAFRSTAMSTKVQPGEIVSIDVGGKRNTGELLVVSMRCAGRAETIHSLGPMRRPRKSLHDLLADAVSANMISDVPLGAFLSGGINSSTVAALMVAAKRGPVRTFSIGFSEIGYDESRYARAVARTSQDRAQRIDGDDRRRAEGRAASCRHVRRAFC